MKVVFISNYINHHQIPFSDALYRRLGQDYRFIQTEPMEEERIRMGWALDAARIPYVVFADQEEERCRQLIGEADLLLAGWTKRTDLFLPRLSSGKLTLRISERIYREGQWKAISPRGLVSKFQEHVRFRNQPVYLLCAGAYVASDFSLIHAYPGKMLKFGYFPEMRTYDLEQLFAKKREEGDCVQIAWASRMIPLKHPEFVVHLAKELKQAGYRFHIHLIGGGPMEEEIRSMIAAEGISDHFTLYGFLKPDEVRSVMERCRMFLFTSSYLEGWGAVLNEAMNSGCCVVANAQAGAVPFLIQDGVNGVSCLDGSCGEFIQRARELLDEPERMEAMGKAAYETIVKEWNADHAAQECLHFYESWKAGAVKLPESGPFSRAEKLSARWKYDEGTLDG